MDADPLTLKCSLTKAYILGRPKWPEPFRSKLDSNLERFYHAGGQYIVDIGCGPGDLLSHIHKRYHNVIGVDSNPDMLDYARKACDSCILFRSIDDFCRMSYKNCHALIFSQSLHLIDSYDVDRLLSDHSLANKALIIWIERIENEGYNNKRRSLMNNFGIIRGSFDLFYGERLPTLIGKYMYRLTSDYSYDCNYRMCPRRIAYYLLSQSHVYRTICETNQVADFYSAARKVFNESMSLMFRYRMIALER